MKKIYTIGHSTHSHDFFHSLLQQHEIDTVVDVRSVPYSRHAEHFNTSTLKNFLKSKNIYYIYLGELLGARNEDQNFHFDDGQVDFQKVVQGAEFKEGVARLATGVANGFRIALMCSEKNPLECHRFSMISRYLEQDGFNVQHILPQGIISHRRLNEKLIDYYRTCRKITLDLDKVLGLKAVQQNLLDDFEIEDLYTSINKMVAYMPTTNEDDQR